MYHSTKLLFSQTIQISMVRPKASDRNKIIAMAFADMVTREINFAPDMIKGYQEIDQHGPKGIFALLSDIFPDLVRGHSNEKCANRKGFSESELTKILSMGGFTSYACRVVDKTGQFRPCRYRKWRNRRWADPSCPEDMEHMYAFQSFLRFLSASSWTMTSYALDIMHDR
mmetsp:Transcript_79178/g.212420  ORF Transcript_79178/g.212420 Transcript_79178/m.212420 type:complete len:170 (+) Transcript_79178:24-533(+)